MATPLQRPPIDPLGVLRDRLDRVDMELHRLLRERFEIVAEIGLAKGPGESVMRPAREGAVLENRLAAHAGTLPREVLAHIWRVLIATACAVQRPYTVHVAGAIEAARFLFGPLPATLHAAPGGALAALADAPGDVAVVALEPGSAAWWGRRGAAHAVAVPALSDGRRAVVLGGSGIAPGTGPAALVVRGGEAIEVRTSDVAADDDLIGRYHPFPVTIPVAR